MALIIQSAAGDSVQLSETPFAQGGEAAVHTVPQYPGVVVKLYHPQVLAKRHLILQEKIETMVSNPTLARFKQHAQLSWPRFSVFDENQQWRGYAMKKADGVPMTRLAHAMAYREHFPGLDRPTLVSYLLSLLRTLHELHRADVSVGDYNPANFLCDPRAKAVTLIDSDSWQVRTADKTYPCPVAAPDMLAPELLGKNLGQLQRSEESERFSLAILLFKVLMLGRHPFDVVGGESPVENIRRGYFPYGIGGGGIPKGPWFNIWSHLPYKLKEQFVRTFKEGCQNPEKRTSIKEWIELFKLYQKEMGHGWHDVNIRPTSHKSSSYKGKQSLSQPVSG